MRAHRSIPTYLCAAIGLLGACSSSPTEPSETKWSPLPPGATLVLLVAPSKTTIKGGQTFQLTASRESPQGQSIAPTEIVWASSDLTVARIGSDGTGLGAGRGTAQITAQWHGMKGAATVTVLGNEPLTGPCPSLAVAAVGASAPRPSKCRAL
jgi:Bacterial Ig-like domain (group 2)